MNRRLQNHSDSGNTAHDYDVGRLNDALWGGRFDRVLAVEAIGSTNSALFELGRAGEAEGLVLLAEEQSGGRGRLDRRWVSPRGKSILMSVLARATIEPKIQGLLNAAAGLAVLDAVEAECGLSLRLKWPNDIVFEGKKLGGILSESGTDRSGRNFWVIGIGLNVYWTADDFPQEIVDSATSLSLIVDSPPDRDALVENLVKSLSAHISELETDPSTLVSTYRQAVSTLGTRVRAKLVAEDIEGIAEDIDEAGDLIVVTDSGERRRIVAGDVTEVRRA
jgi:BirA family biotin operon repressor/biotin-[acetyl-CoA-carboxylase] ligase